jgi:hypothetical protein
MRQVIFLSLLFLLILSPGGAHAAACPNLNVHPGITTLYIQSDFGEKDQASKAYVAGLQDAIKKHASFCLVEDPRAATFSVNLAGVDLGEDHERAAMSVVIISEKGTLLSHWVRVSSVDNVEKNSQDDVIKIDRAIQRSKMHR